uniref:Ribosomal RNA methyltransferase FtsJ domain-containing protein n=1 Tax=Chelonoidis abingdonii TaxID=106734 RepID=A0A8C0INR4_CHEAB
MLLRWLVSTTLQCQRFHITAECLKSKMAAEHCWLEWHLDEPFVKATELLLPEHLQTAGDRLHQILGPGHSVIDYGAAPGAWRQVAVQRPILLSNADITDLNVLQKIQELSRSSNSDIRWLGSGAGKVSRRWAEYRPSQAVTVSGPSARAWWNGRVWVPLPTPDSPTPSPGVYRQGS